VVVILLSMPAQSMPGKTRPQNYLLFGVYKNNTVSV